MFRANPWPLCLAAARIWATDYRLSLAPALAGRFRGNRRQPRARLAQTRRPQTGSKRIARGQFATPFASTARPPAINSQLRGERHPWYTPAKNNFPLLRAQRGGGRTQGGGGSTPHPAPPCGSPRPPKAPSQYKSIGATLSDHLIAIDARSSNCRGQRPLHSSRTLTTFRTR